MDGTTPVTRRPAAEGGARDATVGILLLVAAVTCFAGLDAAAKWVNRTGDPLQTAAFRYLGNFALVALACRAGAGPALPRTRHLGTQVARALFLVGATASSFFAMRSLPLTQATAINFAAPLVVALLAGPVLGEWPGRHRLAAVAAGFLGVLVVTRPWTGAIQPAMLLAGLTAVANACYAIATRLLARRDPPLTTLFYSAAVGTAAFVPVLPLVWAPPGAPAVWLALAATGALATLGHWLLILAHARAAASTLAPFFYAQILGATALGLLVFGEWPDRWTVAGGALVVGSGLYLLGRERARGAGPSADAPA